MPGPNQSMDEGDESGGAEFDDAEDDVVEKQVGHGDDDGDEEDMAVAKELSRRDLFNYYSVWKNREGMARYVPSATKGSRTKAGEIPTWGPDSFMCLKSADLRAGDENPLEKIFCECQKCDVLMLRPTGGSTGNLRKHFGVCDSSKKGKGHDTTAAANANPQQLHSGKTYVEHMTESFMQEEQQGQRRIQESFGPATRQQNEFRITEYFLLSKHKPPLSMVEDEAFRVFVKGLAGDKFVEDMSVDKLKANIMKVEAMVAAHFAAIFSEPDFFAHCTMDIIKLKIHGGTPFNIITLHFIWNFELISMILDVTPMTGHTAVECAAAFHSSCRKRKIDPAKILTVATDTTASQLAAFASENSVYNLRKTEETVSLEDVAAVWPASSPDMELEEFQNATSSTDFPASDLLISGPSLRAPNDADAWVAADDDDAFDAQVRDLVGAAPVNIDLSTGVGINGLIASAQTNCCCHVAFLVISVLMKHPYVKNTIDMFMSFVELLHSSRAIQLEFAEKLKQLNKKFSTLLRPGATRTWTGFYEASAKIVDAKDIFFGMQSTSSLHDTEFAKNYDYAQRVLNTDFQVLEAVRDTLKPIIEIIQVAQKDQELCAGTMPFAISQALVELTDLVRKSQDASQLQPHSAKWQSRNTFLRLALSEFKARLLPLPQIYLWAALLDPRFAKHVPRLIDVVVTSAEIDKYKTAMIDAMVRDGPQDLEPDAPPPSASSREPGAVNGTDLLDRFLQSQSQSQSQASQESHEPSQQLSMREKLMRQLEEFWKPSCVAFGSNTETVLAWWAAPVHGSGGVSRSVIFRSVWRLFVKVAPMQASSSASERGGSRATRQASCFRTRTHPNTIASLVYTTSNLGLYKVMLHGTQPSPSTLTSSQSKLSQSRSTTFSLSSTPRTSASASSGQQQKKLTFSTSSHALFLLPRHDNVPGTLSGTALKRTRNDAAMKTSKCSYETCDNDVPPLHPRDCVLCDSKMCLGCGIPLGLNLFLCGEVCKIRFDKVVHGGTMSIAMGLGVFPENVLLDSLNVERSHKYADSLAKLLSTSIRIASNNASLKAMSALRNKFFEKIKAVGTHVEAPFPTYESLTFYPAIVAGSVGGKHGFLEIYYQDKNSAGKWSGDTATMPFHVLRIPQNQSKVQDGVTKLNEWKTQTSGKAQTAQQGRKRKATQGGANAAAAAGAASASGCYLCFSCTVPLSECSTCSTALGKNCAFCNTCLASDTHTKCHTKSS